MMIVQDQENQMAKRKKKYWTVEFAEPLRVELPTDGGIRALGPRYIVMHHDYATLWIQYGGKEAAGSHAEMMVPMERQFLEKFASQLLTLATIAND